MAELYAEHITVHRHSSGIRGLCLMKLSSETLQNLSYFGIWKPKYLFFISNNFGIQQLDIDQAGINYYKSKVARNEKRKKLFGFFYSKNMTNFEVFR